MNQEPATDAVAQLLLGRADRIGRAIAGALRGSGVGVPHWLVLRHLAQVDTAAMAELGQVAHVPPATLTRTVDKLVDMALVYRVLDGLDRRRVVVRLSDRGAEMMAEYQDAVTAAVDAELNGLDGWEIEALRSILGKAGPAEVTS